MKNYILLLSFVIITNISFAQIFENPIAGKQSHPEMAISKIEITDTETVFYIEVTNKRDAGGWFCADQNIYIKNSNGIETYQLIKSEGIPTCPEQHKFASFGEILKFKLYFPKIPESIEFIDLIENCTNACFYFNGIILNNQHNQNIIYFEKGFDFFQNKKNQQALTEFTKVIQNTTTIDSQIYSLAYYYLILIYNENSNNKKVTNLLRDLKASNLKDKETILKELQRKNIIE